MNKHEDHQEILSKFNIAALNAMQKKAYETILREKDTVLLAPTGSGKTIGFLLPILSLLKPDVAGVQCLIITPSRELATQIEQVWKKMGTDFKINSCFGGHDMQVEIQNLSNPPSLLVGTPGRIGDHFRRKTFTEINTTILVLDEFDKSLALGFEQEMSYIITELHHLEKRILVSATAAIEIPAFTGIIKPKVLDFITHPEDENGLSIKVVVSEDKDKVEALFNLLCHLGAESTLIFCNHREAVERTSQLLQERGIENTYFHGGMEQIDRDQTITRFKNGSVNFLVATDLAARGLDIPEVKNVIHYHIPATKDEFTHRNGRTARMNASGTAYIIRHTDEPLPSFIDQAVETIELPTATSLPPAPQWTTIFISGGKKDKINKMDIVGFFTQKGKLKKEELGLIEVKDFISFAAVRKNKVRELLVAVENEKIKNQKLKVAVAGFQAQGKR